MALKQKLIIWGDCKLIEPIWYLEIEWRKGKLEVSMWRKLLDTCHAIWEYGHMYNPPSLVPRLTNLYRLPTFRGYNPPFHKQEQSLVCLNSIDLIFTAVWAALVIEVCKTLQNRQGALGYSHGKVLDPWGLVGIWKFIYSLYCAEN